MVKGKPRATLLNTLVNGESIDWWPFAVAKFDDIPDELRALVDYNDPDFDTICDSITLMREAGLDVATPEGLAIAVAAGRRRAADFAEQAARHPGYDPVAAEIAERRRRDGLEVRSVVYYARIGTRCKIGYTTDLKKRMHQIMPEELLVTEPGGLQQEGERHRQFSDFRTSGEWFRLEPPLIEHVQHLRRAQNQPDLRLDF